MRENCGRKQIDRSRHQYGTPHLCAGKPCPASRRSRFTITWRSLRFTLRGHSTSNRRPHGLAGFVRTVGRCLGAPCRPLRPAPSCPRAPRGCACHRSCPRRRLPCVRCPSLGRLEHSGLHVLQVLLPLRTHRFFRGFGVTEVLSQSGRELLSRQNPKKNDVF